MTKVSIIIKALNEEEKIAKTVESALAAVATVGGEVILADSASTDRTVEIASRYPIRIVQLQNEQERCCGIGPQLGYQCALGEYVYVLDGDMEMCSGFLERAIAELEGDPSLAGVGGRLVERNLDNLEFQARVARGPANMKSGTVDRLDGGGLYRRSAIERIGYLTNRNLHAYEELELAVRLRSQGYRLARIPVEAAYHFGHTTEAFTLLRRRWKSGYLMGIGEVLRASWGKPHFGLLVNDLRELRIYLIAMAWAAVTLSLALAAVVKPVLGILALGVLLVPIAAMTLRRGSLVAGVYAVTSWLMHGAGLIIGTLRPQGDPSRPVAYRLRREPLAINERPGSRQASC